MYISSGTLSNIATGLRTMKSDIAAFGTTWADGIGGVNTAIGSVEVNWGGPRPTQDLAAAKAYLEDVGDLEGKLTALADAIGAFATAADTYSDNLVVFEGDLSSPDPDAATSARESRDALVLEWGVECVRHAFLIGSAYGPVHLAAGATATGFFAPVPTGTAYYGYVAEFAIEEELDLDEIDPTGQLAGAVATTHDELINHPLAWLILASIETANDDQAITDADGDLSGSDRDDALDAARIAELIREGNEVYGLGLSDEEIAAMVILAVGATALTSASGDTEPLEEATQQAFGGARPVTNEQLNEALQDGVPDFVDEASGLFDEEQLRVTAVTVEGERVFVFTDGTSTAVYAEHVSDTVLVIDQVPTDLTDFARRIGQSAAGVGTAFDLAQLGSAVNDGWQASEGEPLPERALSVVAAAAPAAADIGVDAAAAAAGAAVCSPGTPILSAACAFAAPVFVDFIASFDNPGAPPSFCVDGEFDAEQAASMGFDHTTEEVAGCDPVPSTVAE